MATGRIKGITIQFDADTTQLGTALKKINSEAKGLDNDLRQVNKDLKFNPKNTELIAQKATLLKSKIEQTRKQLDAFKQAQARLDAEGVDKNSQEYMELRRNIIETESKLKHFNAELKKTSAIRFEQVGASFKAVGDKMQTVGKGMSKYITAPIVGAGAAAVKTFNDVQNALNIVAQKTGATGKTLKTMQNQARNLAKTMPTDFETAGTAIGELNTRFGLTGKTLEKTSAQFIKFAKVNNTDLNTSIDQVQKAMAAFGMPATKASAVLDVMTRAGQQTGASMDALESGLIQNAAAFQALGLDMSQSIGFMAQLETSSANSETVMQGMRKALKNVSKEGIPLNQALLDLQNTILNDKNGVDGLTAAYDLFGKSGDQIYNAVRNGSLDFQVLGQAATDSKGALDAVFLETKTPADQFKVALNSVKDTGYELGANIMTMLTPALAKLSGLIKRVSNWWNTLSEDQQNMIIKIAGLIAAIGPLIIVVGKIASGIGAIIGLLPLLAGPAGIAVAAIGGLIAVGVLLYKNWDKIKKKAGELHDWLGKKWDSIKEHTAAAWKAIADAILWPFRKARDGIKFIIEKIRGFFDFDFKLPDIKLPHFAIDPPGWKFRDLLHGEIPHLGIEWYANGGIFNSPSVIGVGEAGAEAVLPIDRLNGMLTNMADSIVNGVNAGLNMQGGGGDIVIPIYLYPSGPKMGEQIVKSYDTYKKQLG